ncbi:D-arabinono-1,4-lactone oxidase [Tilletia horrida]|nr:D-arabinono-1,4-lactone oxidase [Tilletia horrida]
MTTYSNSSSSSGPASSSSARSAQLRSAAVMETTPVGEVSTDVLEKRCASILLSPSSAKARFRNWGGTFHARPARVYQPRTAQHCLEVVELARRKRVQLRAIGRAHSPSDLPFTRDWVLRVEELKGPLEIDTNELTATFLAGTYISDIHDRLAEQSPPLALPNVGSISEQAIGGLISTASHGTGISLPVISASVREIAVVLPLSAGAVQAGQSGAQLVRCNRDEHPELFNATLCGLGATGIIVSVKLSVTNAFRLKQVWEEVPFDSIFGSEPSPSLQKHALEELALTGRPVQESYVGSGAEGSLSIGKLIALDKALPPSPFRFAPSARSKPSRNIRQIWPLDQLEGNADLAEARRRVINRHSAAEVDQAPVLDEDPALDVETSRAQSTLEAVVSSAKHTRIMWFPQSHMCTVMRAEPTQQSATPSSLTKSLHHKLIGYHLTQLLLFMARFNTSLPVPVARLVFRMTHPAIPDEVKAGMLLRAPVEEHERFAASQSDAAPPAVPQRPAFLEQAASNFSKQGFGGSKPSPTHPFKPDVRPTRIDAKASGSDELAPLNPKHAHGHVIDTSWKILNMDCLFPQYTDEWAIPYAYAAPCVRAMREWLAEEEAQPDGARVHFPIEIRFTDADGIFLSPATGRKTCYIGIIQFRPYNMPVRYRVLFRRYERLLRYFGGRPHWAKTHSCSKDELAALYPHLEDWLAVREQVDPERVLANPYVRRHLLGEVGEQVDARIFKSRL